MARTEQGATLTEEHRRAQLQLGARALQDFTRIWPLWTPGDDAGLSNLVAATLPLVRLYRGLSGAVAASYFTAFRSVENVDGTAAARIPPAPADAQVTTSLYVTGRTSTRIAAAGGQDPEAARRTALVRTSGAVTRHVLNGGRATIIESVHADAEANGWARVTDGDPCAFCALLAARGPVYKTEQSADFQAHDHCSCAAEPFYPGSRWPGRGREFKAMYDQAVRDARESGNLDRGTSNDLLNAFRRAYAS